MDPATRQQLVERVWLLEHLRDEARARAHDATCEAQRARYYAGAQVVEHLSLETPISELAALHPSAALDLVKSALA